MKLGLMSVLTIIFVIAKITGYIDWSWWVVFIPTYISIVFILLALALVAVAEAIK